MRKGSPIPRLTREFEDEGFCVVERGGGLRALCVWGGFVTHQILEKEQETGIGVLGDDE
jgi:hypothetical protein